MCRHIRGHFFTFSLILTGYYYCRYEYSCAKCSHHKANMVFVEGVGVWTLSHCFFVPHYERVNSTPPFLHTSYTLVL